VPCLEVVLDAVDGRLEPVGNASVLFPAVGQFFDFRREKHVSARFNHYVVNDNPEIADDLVQRCAQWDRGPLAERFHLDADRSRAVPVVRDNVDPASVARGGHRVPAHPREPVASPVQPNVPGNLRVLFHFLAILAPRSCDTVARRLPRAARPRSRSRSRSRSRGRGATRRRRGPVPGNPAGWQSPLFLPRQPGSRAG